ncbi:NAD(P)H-dependent oxidoreductase [Moorena sp. SIO2C4]|uniref:NADPH-dependent FMN reductase n=1 Tax=Moorena sp. SIO2C4 TaxID=2607824 RepID=UPI0013CD993C|nr:NAD(P)H-dependent oxidoreductase [Moorena sp. SIO2C4]NES45699.1 NAD(P)H-dependent oxidoreductase [Moorena sp. SIO2C4]
MEELSKIKLKIPIVLGSCRIGRESLKVAKFILGELIEQNRIDTELIDLGEYKLPMLEERLQDSSNPPDNVLQFCSKLGQADGILLVTPEYKNGYPGVLKNALDYLEPQALKYKPIGICTVSSGRFGGLDCLAQLRLVCLALGGLPIPDKLPVAKVKELFDENGKLCDFGFKPKIASFINELVWYSEAMVNQKQFSSLF